MVRRHWLLVGLSVGVASLGVFGLTGRPATGAEAQARPAVVAHAVKVGTIDLNRAFKESISVRAAKADLVQTRNQKLQVLKVQREELKQLDQELRNQRALLSDVVRRQKEAESRRKLRQLERMRNDSEQELNRLYLSINRLFLADAKKAIDALGQDAGYSMILNVSNDLILYWAQSVDVTDRLIERMNNNE
ncbi:MAG: OmpH family outer membrane protein [Candidatus Tectimicrobiota bacterium]